VSPRFTEAPESTAYLKRVPATGEGIEVPPVTTGAEGAGEAAGAAPGFPNATL